MSQPKRETASLEDLMQALETIEQLLEEFNSKNPRRTRYPYPSVKIPEPSRWDQDGLKRKLA